MGGQDGGLLQGRPRMVKMEGAGILVVPRSAGERGVSRGQMRDYGSMGSGRHGGKCGGMGHWGGGRGGEKRRRRRG